MAALVCDLCGGKLIMGARGIATCDSCGMEHSADRMKEKVQEIRGTVRVDSTHMIDNYLEMAHNACSVSNYSEAEAYCNKIIEIDPTNYMAWFLKGKAAGWQSTLKNCRIAESVSAFARALANTPEDEIDRIVKLAKEEIVKLLNAMISLRGERFEKWPDEEEASGLLSDIKKVLEIVTQFAYSDDRFIMELSEVTIPISRSMDKHILNAYKNVIRKEYVDLLNDTNNLPDRYELEEFIKRADYCITLFGFVTSLSKDDYDGNIERYLHMVDIQKHIIVSRSWEYKYFPQLGERLPVEDFQLSDEAKELRWGKISDYENKVEELRILKKKKEKEEEQKRIDNYWAVHIAEKKELEKEKETLQKKISELRKEISNLPEQAEKVNVQKRIDNLIAEKKSHGLFKIKEKSAIQEKINAANLELNNIIDRLNISKKKIEKQITAHEERINAIDSELAQPR